MNRYISFLTLVGALVLFVGCAGSDVATSDREAPETTEEDGFKPYDEVIPEEAETDSGLVTTHRVEDDLYFEIPDSVFGREILTVSRQARTPEGLGYGGQEVNNLVLRWERRDDRVHLRVVSHEKTAEPTDPVYQAVQNSSLEPILQSFPIKALNADTSGVVIEVTDLFETDVKAFGLPSETREEHGVTRLDENRSFISEVQSFPENTDVEAVLTYEASKPPSNSSAGTITVEMNHSMVLLPENPMKPRLCDERVGYFGVERIDYSTDEQKAEKRCFITRWRLEPKDPEAYTNGELVEPKEPIVYYIDPATPKKWRPYLKKGIEDWQEAFREAGFKNAIIAKDPPSPEEDSTFDPNDVRYSVIRYFASETQNAYGPHVHDPRSGEILESDIGWYHNVMNLLRNWYFIQTAAANPEARAQVFDEEVMGRLIRFVAAHEVGHTLGLPHNWGASNAVPIDSLRSPSYTSTHGTAPSIMDYARFNYVAQPGDGVTNFTPDIGVYDRWAIEWGYTELSEAGDTPEERASVLDEMIREHAGDPRYFYGRQTGARVDPRSQNEDLGRDAIEASRLGVANLRRVLPNLVEWTREDGETYDTVKELYGEVVAQWKRYMGHVGRHIGGVYETPKTYSQEGPVYEPVSAELQRRAMDFLGEYAFQTPGWMVEAGILRRFEHSGALERVRAAQVETLELLLEPERMARLLEAEAVENDPVYSLDELMMDLRESIWSELGQSVSIDPYRRNLQRGYLERMEYLLDLDQEELSGKTEEADERSPSITVSQSDIGAYVRRELRSLRTQVEQARSNADDAVTEMHLEDVLTRIETILDPSIPQE